MLNKFNWPRSPARGYSEDDGPKLDATSSPNTSRSKEVSAAGKNRQRLEPRNVRPTTSVVDDVAVQLRTRQRRPNTCVKLSRRISATAES